MNNQWFVFKPGNIEPHNDITTKLPPPPPWREMFSESVEVDRGNEPNPKYEIDEDTAKLVNAAMFLRRPLLVTGNPGTGKSMLARAIAYQLNLGKVLVWPITSRSTLKDGLYTYDAIGRLQDTNMTGDDPKPPLGKYFRLGPLGTALLPSIKPWVLLIDEIDKSDIDLPNDLLHVLEDGWFDIPELERVADKKEVSIRIHKSDAEVYIKNGRVTCREFPIVVMTSNGEREFPAPFLRRCIRLDLKRPERDRLEKIVCAHFCQDTITDDQKNLIDIFLSRQETDALATDQLLNAVYLVNNKIRDEVLWEDLLRKLINND